MKKIVKILFSYIKEIYKSEKESKKIYKEYNRVQKEINKKYIQSKDNDNIDYFKLGVMTTVINHNKNNNGKGY
ncbi:hypothetical protein [[Clostridium] dakarense]|uniref:hypothetical protein n=1 Tax=Faecalimicrobium dakarense TaxID=1301100 RepID=UPI0004AFD043|nr:hypothetical protein [[Clostridium] dakarense]